MSNYYFLMFNGNIIELNTSLEVMIHLKLWYLFIYFLINSGNMLIKLALLLEFYFMYNLINYYN